MVLICFWKILVHYSDSKWQIATKWSYECCYQPALFCGWSLPKSLLASTLLKMVAPFGCAKILST